MSAPIRVGMIGLGEVSQLMHLPILADNRDKFAVVALHDVSQSAMAAMAARYPSARAEPDPAALCAASDVDAVFILTPDNTHSRFLAMALQARKHVFLEKPACLTVEEIDQVAPLAAATDAVLFIAYMRRYSRSFLKALELMPKREEIRAVRVRDLIAEGSFFINQTRRIHYPADVPADVISAGRAETDNLLSQVVGADAPPDLKRAYQVLTGLSSHSLSAMREMIGRPKRVISATWRQGGEAIVALFDYGRFVAIYEAMIDNIARFEACIDVLSDRQQLTVNYDTPYIRNLPTHLRVVTSTDDETRTTIHGPDYVDPFQIELDVFHDHVVNGSAPKTSLEDSREDLVLLADIIAAMRRTAKKVT